MRNRCSTLWEEINYYRACNKDLEKENLLRKNKDKQPMNNKKIKENEERIKRLFSAMLLDEI